MVCVIFFHDFIVGVSHFPPFSRLLWGAPAHPERTGAALGSLEANALRYTISAARLRGPSGRNSVLLFVARFAD